LILNTSICRSTSLRESRWMNCGAGVLLANAETKIIFIRLRELISVMP